MIIVLIGPRAAGKTTIGRLLADRLPAEFHDLDEIALMEFRERSITEAWETHGERSWRNAEAVAFERLLSQPSSTPHRVIALGGGAPMVTSIRTRVEQLRASGDAKVAYLQCPIAELAARLARSPGDRPSLTGEPIVSEVADLMAQRSPTYNALADFVLDTGAMSPIQAVEELVRIGPRPRQ